jgi:peptidoglycan/LPS O-acetylase OafA/YrhL
MSTSARSRLKHVDGLRALAALFVVLHHAWLTIFPVASEWPHGWLFMATGWMLYGHFAVAGFIVISGYSLTLAVSDAQPRLEHGTIGFVRRRARRILPPYWIALAVSGLLVLTVLGRTTGTHWDTVLPFSTPGFLVHAALLQDFVPARAPNHVFWSIAVEWHIYFLFPIIVLLWHQRGLPMVVATMGSLALLEMALLPQPWLNSMAPQYILLFVVGVAACSWQRRSPNRIVLRRLPAVAGGLVAAVAVVCILMGPERSLRLLNVLDLPVGLATAAVMVYVGAAPIHSRLKRTLSWGPLAAVGLFSYSVYLMHAPLLQLAWQLLIEPMRVGPGVGLVFMLAVATPLAVAGSYGFFVVAERPFLAH